MKKSETYRKKKIKVKETSSHQKALKKKDEYEKQMKGKQFEKVPHPTLKNTWILKEIN